MKRRAQKVVACIAAYCLVTSAHAGQLSNALEGMYTATTDPQSFKTPSMTGVAFGSFSARFPQQNFNIIAFDPPRLNAGCSGIDMYMGSFSFINADQLKTMLRAFAQGAVGFAFKAAIRAICGSCAATLDDLQAITQRLNEMGKNTCALSKFAMNSLTNSMGVKEKADGNESLLASARKSVDGWWSGMEKVKNGGSSDRANPQLGNLIIRSLYNSQVTDHFGANGGTAFYGMGGDVPELIMNLVGTQVVPTGADDTTTCESGASGSDCRSKPYALLGILNYDHIFQGRSQGGERVVIWKCDSKDTEMSCTKPSEADYTFEGTQRYVQRMLFGDGGNAANPLAGSIMQVIIDKGPAHLTAPQKNFLGSVQSIPLMQIIYRTQRDRSVAQALLSRSGDFIAHEMAYRMVFMAIQVAERSFSKNTTEMPVEIRERIQFLRVDIAKKGYQKPQEITEMLVNIERLVSEMERRWPKLEGMVWRK